jgi:FixJ family two-component response regulator
VSMSGRNDRAMPPPTVSVAIVDDDAPVRLALARLLRASSFETETYASGEEFLSSLSLRTPGCLIVDLQMPGMTGLQLQHHLARAGIKIPTIVITAHDEGGTRERCASAGASAYLLKPLQSATLIAAINAATGRR